MSLLIESQLFPCLSYCKLLINYTDVKINLYDRFHKMSFRNRYCILGANNVIHLTVPIAGGREQKIRMKDVEIDYKEDWPRKHWRSILSSYRKAPFFEYYFDDLFQIIFSKEKFLFQLNIKIIGWLSSALTINLDVDLCELEDYTVAYSNESDYDARNSILPKNYQEGEFNLKPRYSQTFGQEGDFVPNLSIIDLLFCEGPNAKKLLLDAVIADNG